MHNPANRHFDNMWWRSAVLFGILCLYQVLVQSVVQVIEDIAHQAFRTVGYVDTLIYWDASEYIASSISTLTYPKIIVDRTKGLANFFCENRLVIMELDGANEVSNSFFVVIAYLLKKFMYLSSKKCTSVYKRHCQALHIIIW